jgi:hypothetical protein
MDMQEIMEMLHPSVQIIRESKRGRYCRSGLSIFSCFSFGDYVNPEVVPKLPLLAIVEYVSLVLLKWQKM